MKRIVTFFLFFSLFAASVPVYGQNPKAEGNSPKNEKARLKAEKKAQERAAVIQSITDKNIVIAINRIYPMDGVSKNTSDGYTVKLIHDSLTCYLPYFGSSKTPVYGGQNLAIESNGQPVEVQGGYDEKSDSYIYQCRFKNENMKDTWTCVMQIFTNGTANIRMEGVSRDPISYTGDFKISDKK